MMRKGDFFSKGAPLRAFPQKMFRGKRIVNFDLSVKKKIEFQTTAPLYARTATPRRCRAGRRAVPFWMPFLCRSTKKWRKKGNEGQAPSNPAPQAAQRFAPSVASLSLRQGGAQRFCLAKFRVFALKKREYTTAAVRPKCLRFSLNRKRENFTKQNFQAAPWRNASKASHSAT